MKTNKKYFKYKNIEAISKDINYIDDKFDEITEVINTKFQKINNIDYKLSKITEDIDFNSKELNSQLNQTLISMTNELKAVKNIALEKEVKIQRYEAGYNYSSKKSFIKEILRVVDFAKSQTNINNIAETMLDDLEILLENEGIEKIDINLNEKYDGNEKIAKVVEIEETDKEILDGSIYQIKRDGYFIELSEERRKIIRPTDVILYKYKKEELSLKIDSEDEIKNPEIDQDKNILSKITGWFLKK